MKILIMGGDGFCGWPTSLHLSNIGHDIIIVDNLSRRKIDIDLDAQSLTPISSITQRINAWKEVSGKCIKYYKIDASKDYYNLLDLIKNEHVDSIVHFAEQRSAPYSMKGEYEKRYTVNNNINCTNNILCAIVESGLDIHLVHLGTMGVYGYGTAGMKIPEGYLKVKIMSDSGKLNDWEILYPAHPGSVYHMTKTQDALMFYYYNKNDKIRITDLHQGIVWGTNTKETSKDIRLINRFDYDGDYGTVLNRFLMQAATGYPLTVHGTGGQTRAFIHIQDTVRCIEIALNNPPQYGERVKIFNQMTQTFRVRDLAAMVARLTGSEIKMLPNPRNEDNENELYVENKCFLDLGLQPITLQDRLLLEVRDIALKYKDRCDFEKILCRSYWTKKQKDACENSLNQYK